jgi:hypothetical protein
MAFAGPSGAVAMPYGIGAILIWPDLRFAVEPDLAGFGRIAGFEGCGSARSLELF